MTTTNYYRTTGYEYRVDDENFTVKMFWRQCYYELNEPLPDNWSELSTDNQAHWMNENARFIKDHREELADDVIEVFYEVEKLDDTGN